MRELESGAIANPTEERMVGHYWLRNPALAPTPQIRAEIEETIQRIKKFADDIRTGRITAENGKRFEHVLHVGIGGSALGPEFVATALGSPHDPMDISFFDNTDPDGFDRVFDKIGDRLSQTLVVVVSKSGGTKGNTQWNAGGGSEIRCEGTSISKARCRRYGRWERVGQTCRSKRMAGALPDA